MILVNGEKLQYTDKMTVTDVLKVKNYIFPLLIVKIDGVIIPRESYSLTVVPNNSNIQVIHLISGG